MDIRIEAVAGDPPTWKVFLGTFFWSCETLGEAVEWAQSAAPHINVESFAIYQLPVPPRAVDKKNDSGSGAIPGGIYSKGCP